MSKISDAIDSITTAFLKTIKESSQNMITYCLMFEDADDNWYKREIRSDIFPEDDKLFEQTVRHIVRESITDFALQTGREGRRLYAPIMFDTSYDAFSFSGTLRVGWSTYYPEVTDGNE